MDCYMIPSRPTWTDTNTLDIISRNIPSEANQSVIYPYHFQIPAGPLLLQKSPSSPMMHRTGQKIPTRHDWESHRSEITRLYRDEKRTLTEVMKFMCERHDFRATPKMYKSRISDWDIRRNLRWSEREDACRVVKQRLVAGEKVSRVVVRGQEKSLAVFLRHMRSVNRDRKHGRLLAQAETCQTDIRIATFKSSLQVEAPRATLYPAGDGRYVEVICMQTAHICQTSSNKPVRSCDDLFRNLWQAVKRACEGRYYEARVMLNRAADYFQWHARREADIVLLYFLSSLALRSGGKLQHFDPLDLFHKQALAMSEVIHGPCHPLTVILSQLLAVEDCVVVVSRAAHVAVDAIQANTALSKFHRLTHCSRERFAEILEASGDYAGAGKLRLEVLTDYQLRAQERRDPIHEIKAISSLAWHYFDFEPHRFEETVKLFQSIQHVEMEPATAETRAYGMCKSFRGLAGCAERTGDLTTAECYHRIAADAAARCWGEGSSESVEGLERLARCLDLQGRHGEAESVWKQCEFTDQGEDSN